MNACFCFKQKHLMSSYYYYYIYIALPMCLQAGIQVRFTMIYIQFILDKFFFCDDSSCFMLLWPVFCCPSFQVESGWGMMLITPDRRVDPCLHNGHPPRPQLPPTHSNCVPGRAATIHRGTTAPRYLCSRCTEP